MKTILIISAFILSFASLTASAEETSSGFSWGDVTFQPRAYIGYADYSLKSENFTKLLGNGEIKESPIAIHTDLVSGAELQFSGPIYGIGATVASGNFFSDLYYQSTPNDNAYSGYVNENIDSIIGSVNAKHYDWAISVGYMITEQWSIFAGYKSGVTNWDQTIARSDGNEAWNGEFKQDGPFLGVSYSLQIEPGILSFRAAYAYLDGKFERNISGIRQDELKLDGNSNAYSLGLSWTQSLTDNLGLSIGANYQNYDFNLSGGRQSSNSNEGNVTIKNGSMTETLFTFTAAIIYRF